MPGHGGPGRELPASETAEGEGEGRGCGRAGAWQPGPAPAYLPKELQKQTAAVLRAAWKLDPKEGLARLCTQIEWLERSYPKAAASLREGMEETFTINRLGLSPMLRKCLATTNVIESSLSGVEGRTGRVTRWRDGAMCLRWAAAAALETEQNFRKIIGHEDLWMLQAVLKEGQSASNERPIPLDEERVAA